MTTDSPLRTRIRSALTTARLDRDRPTVAALRSVLSALENAEAIPVESAPRAGALEASAGGAGAADAPRRILTDREEAAILEREVVEQLEAVRTYETVAPERAAEARAAVDVLAALR